MITWLSTTIFTEAPIAFSSRFSPASRFARDYVDLRNPAKLRSALAAKPKAVWVESPTNPLMNLVDIRAVSAPGARIRGAGDL